MLGDETLTEVREFAATVLRDVESAQLMSTTPLGIITKECRRHVDDYANRAMVEILEWEFNQVNQIKMRRGKR